MDGVDDYDYDYDYDHDHDHDHERGGALNRVGSGPIIGARDREESFAVWA